METIEQLYLTVLRDKHTTLEEFRKASDQLAGLLAHRAAAELPIKNIQVDTPLAKAEGHCFDESIILVPILRSGLAMLPEFQKYFQQARVGFAGFQRDEETAEAEFYYLKIPEIRPDDWVLILDPMIATGGTAVSAIERLLKEGCTLDRMLFVSVISAPEGLENVRAHYPDLTILTSATDSHLNEQKFIVPGLGDFGDRYFGTE